MGKSWKSIELFFSKTCVNPVKRINLQTENINTLIATSTTSQPHWAITMDDHGHLEGIVVTYTRSYQIKMFKNGDVSVWGVTGEAGCSYGERAKLDQSSAICQDHDSLFVCTTANSKLYLRICLFIWVVFTVVLNDCGEFMIYILSTLKGKHLFMIIMALQNWENLPITFKHAKQRETKIILVKDFPQHFKGHMVVFQASLMIVYQCCCWAASHHLYRVISLLRLMTSFWVQWPPKFMKPFC